MLNKLLLYTYRTKIREVRYMPSDLFATQIRFDYELRDKIQQIADEEKRSFNAQMVYFLEDGVRRHRPKRKIRKPAKDEDK